MDEQLVELRTLASGAQNRLTETGIPRVVMVKGAIPQHQLAVVYEPMINLILCGRKSMTVGQITYEYNPATYFVMSVDLPAIGNVFPDSSGEPYLAIALLLDRNVINSFLQDLPDPALAYRSDRAFAVAPVNSELLDAWIRMLRLMKTPKDIGYLAPLYEREILFRVLQGPQGGMLRNIAASNTSISRLGSSIRWLKENYEKQLRIDELAEMCAMSVSNFHRQFKATTSMSPLQFQKQIRLLNARSMLVRGTGNVNCVSYMVGYQSPNQFSREYARFFGLPPSRDLQRLIAENSQVE